MPRAARRHTYRHGNLKAEAITAAYAMLSDGDGPRVSLRRVADAVGVAHRSLYNHFADREELLNAVATEGFLRLAASLRLRRTRAAFVARFVRFALDHPSLYDVMTSRRHATLYRTPELQAAVHAVITEAFRFFVDPSQPSEERRRAVMRAYILIHGGITLHRAGILDVRDSRGLVTELAKMLAGGEGETPRMRSLIRD